MQKIKWLIFLPIFLFSNIAHAKIDVATLPKRDKVQLTIYNSADLTLVRDKRNLTLTKGLNKLQFSWANTLIDPTSLDMLPVKNSRDIDIFDLTFPPRVKDLGLWHLKSGINGQVPVEITYLTSGLSWRAFYLGTLTQDEKTMRLQGYVRVTNNSGEDYENAQTRLIVGKVNLIDEIAALAQRQYPYGRPGVITHKDEDYSYRRKVKFAMVAAEKEYMLDEMAGAPKKIKKEGLSEYFLYTIEGTETILTGWSKRLPSFEALKVPVVNLYKYEEERYGNSVVRFLSFKNDEKHKLGETPIPGGVIKMFRSTDNIGHFSYEGQSSFKYIPVDEDVELNLGNVNTLIVKPTLMNFKTGRFMFDKNKNIIGWDEIREFKIEVNNTRNIPAKVEITRNFNASNWGLEKEGDYGKYKKIDHDTARFTLVLNPRTKKEFTYRLTTHHGKRGGQ